jgi:hypothetical protein
MIVDHAGGLHERVTPFHFGLHSPVSSFYLLPEIYHAPPRRRRCSVRDSRFEGFQVADEADAIINFWLAQGASYEVLRLRMARCLRICSRQYEWPEAKIRFWPLFLRMMRNWEAAHQMSLLLHARTIDTEDYIRDGLRRSSIQLVVRDEIKRKLGLRRKNRGLPFRRPESEGFEIDNPGGEGSNRWLRFHPNSLKPNEK